MVLDRALSYDACVVKPAAFLPYARRLENAVSDLVLATQAAHLQKRCGQALDGEQRSIARAEFIRQRLENGGASQN